MKLLAVTLSIVCLLLALSYCYEVQTNNAVTSLFCGPGAIENLGQPMDFSLLRPGRYKIILIAPEEYQRDQPNSYVHGYALVEKKSTKSSREILFVHDLPFDMLLGNEFEKK